MYFKMVNAEKINAEKNRVYKYNNINIYKNLRDC